MYVSYTLRSAHARILTISSTYAFSHQFQNTGGKFLKTGKPLFLSLSVTNGNHAEAEPDT